MLKTDLAYVLANYKWVKREKLPSVYTAEEVNGSVLRVFSLKLRKTVSCSNFF